MTNTTTYTYDADGNRTAVTDADGRITRYSYDFVDRKTSETRYRVSGQAETTAYIYDQVGNRTAVVAPGSQPLGDTSGTDLTVDGASHPRDKSASTALDSNSYRSLTLTNGGWIAAPQAADRTPWPSP